LTVSLNGIAQDFQNQPKILKIDYNGDIELSLNPDGQKLLGCFVSRDTSLLSLVLSNDNPFTVWIDGKLYKADEDYHDLLISDIFSNNASEDTVFVSFYDEKGFTDFRYEFVYRQISQETSDTNVQLRQATFNKNVLIVLFLFFLLLLAIFRFSSGDTIVSYFQKVFLRNIRVSIFENDSNTTYLEIVLASFLTGMAVWHIENSGENYFVDYFRLQLLDYLKYSGITLLFLIAKYLLLRLVSFLNGLTGVHLIQFVDFLKFLIVISIILNLLFFTIYWSGYYPVAYISNTWEYFYPVMYILFTLYYFFKLSSAVTGKKLLIISYLCTTEILGAYLVASILIN